MRIVYVTDLHGIEWKYDRLFQVVVDSNLSAVVNGGDMLPKGRDIACQGDFIVDFLDPHFKKYNDAGVDYLCCLGNDDLKRFDPLFKTICDRYPHVHDIAQCKIELSGFEFIGMNWVVDYPFRLKDRCRMDTEDYVFQEQFGSGLLSTDIGWRELEDWFAYAKTLPTIEEELNRLVQPDEPSRTIYSIHMPPFKMGLDKCAHGLEVGSKAVYGFLKRKQPRLSLHGHIHESPACSEKWWGKIGQTVCIQPGQLESLSYVLIDLDTMEFEGFALPKRDEK
ncbi:MAG: metallophosphoesterase [Deltaproteobacteria bacterium]|nr:metallophosphoesterase [Deltaproteobacteria bacterium]